MGEIVRRNSNILTNTQTTSDTTSNNSSIELTVISSAESGEFSTPEISTRRKSNSTFRKRKNSQEFLNLMIKNTIIMIIFCLQVMIVDVIWYFEIDGYVSIVVPMNIISVNTIIDAVCVLLSYKFGIGLYHFLCKCNDFMHNGSKCGCHYCCNSFFTRIFAI